MGLRRDLRHGLMRYGRQRRYQGNRRTAGAAGEEQRDHGEHTVLAFNPRGKVTEPGDD